MNDGRVRLEHPFLLQQKCWPPPALKWDSSRVRNLNVAVREWEDQVVFLHRIVEGGTDRSYGIHVARLAGVPRSVLDRARQLLSELAVHHVGPNRSARHRRSEDESQLQLFVDPTKEIAQSLKAANLDQTTPQQALDLLREWQQRLSK